MKLVRLLYADWMSESEIQENENSDRIWVPNRVFQRWMNEEDVGSLVIVELDSGIKKVGACMFGAHSGENNVIYVPSWICHEMKVSGEPPCDDDVEDAILMLRKRPHQCTFVKLQPFTSAHLHASEQLDEPAEDILSRGLEAYTCLSKGQVLTVQLPTGEVLGMEVLDANPEADLVCIRAGEIELELMPPLDLLENELEAAQPVVPEPTPVPEPAPEPMPASVSETREERRRKMAAAAMARLAAN